MLSAFHHLLLFMAAASSASGAAALPRGASARPAIGRAARADLIAASASASPVPTADAARGLRTAWGVCGFLGILAQAIGRLAPIAMQPILQRDITMLQWGLCGPPASASAVAAAPD